MLGSVLAASYVVPVRAQPHFTLYAVLNPDPWPTFYGGYHDFFYELQIEFAKIDIDLQIDILPDMYSLWELMWSPAVPEGGRPGGHPPQGGWDITAVEWSLYPQGMLWMDGLILSKSVINGPARGCNVFPYFNRESDCLYWEMQTSFDAETRQGYAWAWQEELMHNPPMINIYYPHVYHVRGRYIEGYDPTVWWYDTSHLFLNQTTVTQYESQLGIGAVNRLRNEKTIVYGVDEEWWSYLVTWCDSRTEELYQNLVSGTLYKSSVDPWPAEGMAPPSQDYILKPWLTSDLPQDIGWETNVTLNDEYRVRIPLREGVVWSDDDQFDAEDVVWTINNLILDPAKGCTATADFKPIMQYAEYKNGIPPGQVGYDPYAVDLILYEPYVDLPLILANSWGSGILPKHFFMAHGGPPEWWSIYNCDFHRAKEVPVIGPYKFLAETPPSGSADISFEVNTKYFGYDLGWGPTGIDKIILDLDDDGFRIQVIRREYDFSEPWIAPVSTFESMKSDPTLLVYVVPRMASNGVWMNFNNLNLSNRYVRLALAHAIPYKDIFTDTLPGWGAKDPIPGGTFVLPWQYYQGKQLFNEGMERYTYNLTKAQQYLNMWLYSQQAYAPQGSAEVALGPVGDANFDGLVDLDDLLYWLEEVGNAPLTRKIEAEPWWDPSWLSTYYSNIFPKAGGPVSPGNDIDPDFDNSGTVDSADLALWIANYGKEYPFPGAW